MSVTLSSAAATPIAPYAPGWADVATGFEPATQSTLPNALFELALTRNRDRQFQLTVNKPSAGGQKENQAADILDALIGRAFRVPNDDAVLQRTWAMEAMHRSMTMVKLVLLNEARWADRPRSPICRQLEVALAKKVSILFHSLSATAGTRLISCGHALAGITTGLGGLFGAIGGDVIVSVEVSEVWLSPIRHRALILVAVELVTRTLLRNAARSSACRMGVSLFVTDDNRAILLADDNCPEMAASRALEPLSVLDDLAEILGADILVRSRKRSLVTEVSFPL